MTAQLPPATQKQFDKIIEKLVESLQAAPELTSARSEFMNNDGSMGGQVLDSNPRVAHPQHEITELYMKLFAQAKKDGLDLRRIETVFDRKKAGAPWAHKTRWITADEFKAFVADIAPIVEEIRVALRQHAAAAASDWYSISFDPGPATPRIIVMHGEKVRIVSEPTPALLALAGRVAKAATEKGLQFSGASWRVKDEMDDAEGEIDSSVVVIRAWPEAS